MKKIPTNKYPQILMSLCQEHAQNLPVPQSFGKSNIISLHLEPYNWFGIKCIKSMYHSEWQGASQIDRIRRWWRWFQWFDVSTPRYGQKFNLSCCYFLGNKWILRERKRFCFSVPSSVRRCHTLVNDGLRNKLFLSKGLKTLQIVKK